MMSLSAFRIRSSSWRSVGKSISFWLSETFPSPLTLIKLGLAPAAPFLALGSGRLRSRSLTDGAVVIMKMTSNTKAKSSNGVIFNSFIVLWWDLANFFIWSNCLLFCLGIPDCFGRHAHLEHVCLLQDIEHVDDVLVFELAVSPDDDTEISVFVAQLNQPGVKAGQVHLLRIQRDLAAGPQTDIIGFLRGIFGLGSGFGQS